ncbi:unnamed protein product, partial [Discosporangium mesarthrocarpum]
MVGVVMSYRLAPEFQHPEQVKDVARAIGWIHRNITRYGGDPNDVTIVGHSAGAHLAALCLSEGRWLREQGLVAATTALEHPWCEGDARPSPAVVTGLVGLSGVYDVPRMAMNSVGAMLARTAFGEGKRAWVAASPVHRVQDSAGGWAAAAT